MKTAIHPTYHPHAQFTCACGNSFTTGSTAERVEIELCNACHPFYTGKQKFVDTARRVEKFQERLAQKTAKAGSRRGRTVKRAVKAKKRVEKMAGK